jgi:hypothetical protein
MKLSSMVGKGFFILENIPCGAGVEILQRKAQFLKQARDKSFCVFQCLHNLLYLFHFEKHVVPFWRR